MVADAIREQTEGWREHELRGEEQRREQADDRRADRRAAVRLKVGQVEDQQGAGQPGREAQCEGGGGHGRDATFRGRLEGGRSRHDMLGPWIHQPCPRRSRHSRKSEPPHGPPAIGTRPMPSSSASSTRAGASSTRVTHSNWSRRGQRTSSRMDTRSTDRSRRCPRDWRSRRAIGPRSSSSRGPARRRRYWRPWRPTAPLARRSWSSAGARTPSLAPPLRSSARQARSAPERR